MRASSGFTPVEGPHVTQAALCAVCHTLFTPTVDDDGNVVGTFPEQMAFLEWEHSDFSGQTPCQDCHMPNAEGALAISTIPPTLPERSPFAQHHFVGGNVLMLRILQAHRGELEVAASATDFDGTIARTLAQLQNDAANLAISFAVRNQTTLTADVTVENLTGHKYPTGFPSRRVWVHFTVVDGEGATIFESGSPGADGTITGDDADASLTAFEPHHTEITDPQEVQIYQSVMEDNAENVTYTLLRAAGYAKDNRLLPTGFDKTTASNDFAVVGGALTDNDFHGGSDTVRYEIDVTGRTGPFTVSAELLYQAVATPFVEDIRPAGTTSSDRFVTLFDGADRSPVLVATAEQTVN
jgi:hypothetical protein